MKQKMMKYLFPALLAALACACADEQRELPEIGSPAIAFSDGTGEYKVKIGREITLSAGVTNAVNPVYAWKLDGKIIAADTLLAFRGEKLGEYFLTFRVDADNGSAEAQVKLTVADKLPPRLKLGESFAGFTGADTPLVPDVENPDGVTYAWMMDGKVIGTDSVLLFNQAEVTVYNVILSATNEDGKTLASASVTLLPEPLPALFFDDGYYRSAADRPVRLSVPEGRRLALVPVKTLISDNAVYRWEVDGAVQPATGEFFTFAPAARGVYQVKVTATDDGTSVSAEVAVECVAPEGTYRRLPTAASRAVADKAYAFVQAPGQHVSIVAGTTEQDMTDRATKTCLASDGSSYAFSIGAFGGYVVVGFDHSVEDVASQPDLQIVGNAFAGWSEPGIVYVMQDENGNGLPDDTWYELKGSEYGTSNHIARYALTYFRPKGAGILWVDNFKNAGAGTPLAFDVTKYPNFIAGDRVTFVATCLLPTVQEGGIITSIGYDWGYVDNINSRAGFYIEDAVQVDGSPANLKYIDFVKVQTGMNATAGGLGEISTDTGVAVDMHLQ
ncbi:MAG: hypothetical protein LBK12_05020 [Odoribacteraceae bacterium]|jgi:hypothetical protein|nr:hypothetical protein [Odoribacteraceae bacterium]